MEKIQPHYRLDLQGESCPYPAIHTLEALKEMNDGEIVEVISDCSQSINNIPYDVKNHGYTLLKIEQDGAILRFLIQK